LSASTSLMNGVANLGLLISPVTLKAFIFFYLPAQHPAHSQL
jgi:hypothetical protein